MKGVWLPIVGTLLSLILVVQLRTGMVPLSKVHLSRLPPPESLEQVVNQAKIIVLADIISAKQGPDFVAPIEETSDFHRVPSYRIIAQVAEVYKGEAFTGQTITMYQDSTGVTEAKPSLEEPPQRIFLQVAEDPMYRVGDRYLLMLAPVPIPEAVKRFQPEPWQEGMFMPVFPEGRLIEKGNVVRLVAELGDSTVGKQLDDQPLERVEQLIKDTMAGDTQSSQ